MSQSIELIGREAKALRALRATRQHRPITCADVTRHLGMPNSSPVAKALSELRQRGLATHSKARGWALTDAGRDVRIITIFQRLNEATRAARIANLKIARAALPKSAKPHQQSACYEDADDMPIQRIMTPAGKWTAQIPAVRSVFDMGAAWA